MDFLTTIRIYNDPSDNRTFVRQMVHDFEIFDGIDELKEGCSSCVKHSSPTM